MMHGDRGSLETFWTFPPTAKARPEGVSRGWVALGGFATCGREEEDPKGEEGGKGAERPAE